MLTKGLESVFRHKKLLAAIFLSIMGLTIAVTAWMPRQYESNMQIVVQDSREKPLEAADKSAPVGSQASSEELIESRVNSEMELLSASDIMESAVTFRAGLVPNAPSPAPGSYGMAKQVDRLNSHIKLTPVRKTTILEVSYRDVSPEAAQKILQEIQRAYLSKHLRVLRPEGTEKVFADREAYSNDQLTKTQQQLVDFQIANHVTSIPEETEVLTKELADIKDALLSEERDTVAQRAQTASLHRMLDVRAGALPQVPERVTTASRVSSNFYAVQQVEGILVDLQNKRTQLLTRFQPKDKLVLEVEEQIANTKASLKQMQSDPNVETDTDINPVWNQLQQQLRGSEVAAASSEARLASLREQAATTSARLDQLQRISVENDRLNRAVSELRDTEKIYADKTEHEHLEDVLDQDKVGNIAVAMEPTYSAYPVSPRVLMNLVLGFVTALFACVAALFLIESTRSTVFVAADLEVPGGLRVLSTVPEFSQQFGAAGPETYNDDGRSRRRSA